MRVSQNMRSQRARVILPLVGCSLIAGCQVLGPVYGDPIRATIRIENSCRTTLDVLVSEYRRPSVGDETPASVRAGERVSTGSSVASGVFNVLAVGPEGGEFRAAVQFGEDQPDVEVTIEGDACPD